MPRRQESRFEDFLDWLVYYLTDKPAWLGPLIALVVLIVLSPLHCFAVVMSAAVLIAWGFAEYQKRTRRVLLDNQTGLDSLKKMGWRHFEQLVAEAYRRKGYTVEETPEGPDGGVDLILLKDGQRILVQCKQWKQWRVGVRIVRELFGVMTAEDAHYCILVTTGRCTREAKRFAEGKRIGLIEGQALWELVREVQTGKGTQESKPEESGADSSNPPQQTNESPEASETGEAVLLCPRCGSKMVLRTARRGEHEGKQFYGCSRFPGCRAIINIDQQ